MHGAGMNGGGGGGAPGGNIPQLPEKVQNIPLTLQDDQMTRQRRHASLHILLSIARLVVLARSLLPLMLPSIRLEDCTCAHLAAVHACLPHLLFKGSGVDGASPSVIFMCRS